MKVYNKQSINVAFLTKKGICYVTVNKTTDRFNYNGQQASRYQFPIQNAFSLTVHKTQGLTLPDITISLDSQMFAPRQSYVAINRAKTWDSVNIITLDRNAIKTDEKIITEYQRLQVKYDNLVSSFN